MTSAVSGLSAALYKDEAEEYVVTAALGSNRDICFVSLNHAVPSIEIVVSGLGTDLTISVAGSDVTVNSATDGAGVATSTAAQIVAAVNADAAANLLWLARLPPGSTGAGVTGALAHTHGTNGLAYIEMALVDSGDHIIWQAAALSRYWTTMTKLEKQVHGAGDWVEITTGFQTNLLQGKITMDAALNADDLVRVTGVRRSNLAFEKVLLLYDGKMKIEGKEIDTSNVDDDGWGSTITGAKSWELTAAAYYYPGNVSLTEFGVDYIWKFYSINATSGSFTGHGTILGIDELVASPDKAQETTITVKGKGELYPEA